MKNAKHTPGPWTAVYTPSMNLAGVHIRPHTKTLEISYCNSSSSEIPEGDARLMAAAPEMLAALETVNDLLQNPDADSFAAIATLDLIKNVIAKARGEK